ncbi:helix-turn-helix domain-containing protein [Microbulbifer sp. PSTR4-B]|uniref:helix-turn-helix domain-containing protein n=1 Tax=Microbulbifer sp. PSTR4-B TaxID=3243396 RepID=UPI00403A2D83
MIDKPLNQRWRKLDSLRESVTDSIQNRLKIARKAAKLSQAEVAQAAGITQPAYSQLESGRTRKGTSLIPIARALGVDAHWLTSGRGKMLGESIEDIRLRNLQLEIDIHGEEAISQKLESVIPGGLQQVLDGNISISNRLARRIEPPLQQPQGWLDCPHDAIADAIGFDDDHFGDLFEESDEPPEKPLSKDFIELVKLIKEKIQDGSLDHDVAQLLKQNIEVMTRKK